MRHPPSRRRRGSGPSCSCCPPAPAPRPTPGQRSWPNTCAAHPDLDLADVAHTLQAGRREFEHRRALVGHDVTDVVSGLAEHEPQRLLHAPDTVPGRGVGLVLAGVGEQYAGMAAGLYAAEPVFAAVVDECAAVLNPLLGLDLREVLFGDGRSEAPAARASLAGLLRPGGAGSTRPRRWRRQPSRSPASSSWSTPWPGSWSRGGSVPTPWSATRSGSTSRRPSPAC